MSSLKGLRLGLAAAIGLFPACEKPAEQPKQEVIAPTQEVMSACERFHVAIGMEVIIEQMASDPAAWKLLPAPLAETAWKDAHAESMSAATALPEADRGDCLREITEDISPTQPH